MAEKFGEYIITEGTDGTGKTTVANLLALRAYKEGHEVIRVDEPDSAYVFNPDNPNPESLLPIASEIRRIIKDGTLGRTALNNVHLFTASRVENWYSATLPALQRGAWVIGARNWLSTLVYQGYAEGFNPQMIKDITLQSLGTRYMTPDHLFILDLLDEDERQRRIDSRGQLEVPDTFESMGNDFQQRLRNGYRTVAHDYNVTLTDASGSKDEIANILWSRIHDTM